MENANIAEDRKIKVYVKINNKDEITDINSGIFIEDLTGWVEIDDGFGDKYAHAQSLYLPEPIMDDEGQYNYFLYHGKPVRKAIL